MPDTITPLDDEIKFCQFARAATVQLLRESNNVRAYGHGEYIQQYPYGHSQSADESWEIEQWVYGQRGLARQFADALVREAVRYVTAIPSPAPYYMTPEHLAQNPG